MSEITTKPFRESHLDIFKVVPAHQPACIAGAAQMTALGQINQFGSHLLDGRILYISGYMWVVPGVVEVYMHPSIYVQENVRIFWEHVKWWLVHVQRITGARRIQTWGDDTPESDRWLKHLGFTQEAVLHSYRRDGNMSIWGIVCKG